MMLNEVQKPDDATLILRRTLNAPQELAFKVWTSAEHIPQWMQPEPGMVVPFATMDLRVGGKYLNCMRSPKGKEYWGTGVFHEIIPMERLVFTDSFADEKGNVVPATYYGMSSDFPLEMLVTVTFEDQDGKTKMTLRHTGLPAGPDSEGTHQGWSESFDKLEESLK